MATGRFRSIANRFSLALIGVIAVVLVVFAGTAIFMNFTESERKLRAKLDASLKLAEVALQIPIWNVDYLSAQGVIDALMQDEEVVYAEVVVDDVPVAVGQADGTPGGDFSLLQDDPDLMTGQTRITFADEDIGTLQVALSRASVTDAVTTNAAGVVLLTLLIIGAVAIMSMLTARRYVAHPMEQLQASASAIAAGELDAVIAVDRNDEIGSLARDFDSMRRSVKRLVGELQEANRTLEARVVERTRDLEATSERLQLALSMDGVGIWSADLTTGEIWWSDEYAALMGHGPEDGEVSPTGWEDFLHPDNRAEVYRQFARLLAGGETVNRMRKHFVRKNGSAFWVDSLMRIERDETGKAIRLIGLDVDITDQLARERELAVVSERLGLALQIDQVGIYDADFKADTLWWSPEYTAMLGHDPETYAPIPPISWEERLHPSNATAVKARMERFLGGDEERMRLRQRMLTAQGQDIWLDAVMRVQRDADGAPERLTGLAVDVTEQLRREQRLADANRQIVESLHYARRIQSAILPGSEAIDAATRENFLIWEPRDIVGGDLFWHFPINGGHAIIVGDCTGHGVPGAFMTLIACGLLDRALQLRADSPGEVLRRLHRDLQSTLGQDQENGETDDGLDAGICFVKEAERKVIFSGARLSLFHAGQGGMTEIKGGRSGVGYRRFGRDTEYRDISVDIAPGDRFYLTTDGLIDQIGGPRHLSFGKRRFRQTLEETRNATMQEQGLHLTRTFKAYQGSEKRRDDVTVLGFAPAVG